MTAHVFAPSGCGAKFGLPLKAPRGGRARTKPRQLFIRSVAPDSEDGAAATKPSEPVGDQLKNSNNGFLKEDVGPLTGLTGGWPGGEKGLLMFVGDSVKSDLRNQTPASTGTEKIEEGTVRVKVGNKQIRAKKVGPGKDAIYIGFKDDSYAQTEARRRGEMGAFIVDDARKYPAKEKLGPLPGVTGGFAGGERGVQQFVSKGEIDLLGPDDPSGRQNSPLVVSTIVAGVGTVGGILLTDLFDVGEKIAGGELFPANLDDDTKILLEVAIGLLLFVLGGIASITTLRTLSRKVRTMATKAAVAGGFWLCVFLIAYEIMRA